ncbi:hypothetical protein BY996DRAFT_1583336 [Phakopsora pachyrhizi]|nr:hypothetical protein BY996DRAFT_1583336 [Phakopsora pachyrhizi]
MLNQSQMKMTQSAKYLLELSIFRKQPYFLKNFRWSRDFAVLLFVAAFLGNFYLGCGIAPGVPNLDEASVVFHASSSKAENDLQEIMMNAHHEKPPEFQEMKNSGQVLDGAHAEKPLLKGMNLDNVKNGKTLPKSKDKSSLSSFLKGIKDRIKKMILGIINRLKFFGNTSKIFHTQKL